MANPWATAAVRTGSLHRTFPDALAALVRRARAQACLEGMPDTTRLRVTLTSYGSGSVWLDGEPLPPAPGCSCTYDGPDESCPTHGRAACDALDGEPLPPSTPVDAPVDEQPPTGTPCTCSMWEDGTHVLRDRDCPQHGETCTCDAVPRHLRAVYGQKDPACPQHGEPS